MSLDKKSLTELRSIYQGMGGEVKWDDGKNHLIQKIQLHVAAKVQQPERPIEINIKQDSNAPVSTPEMIEKALEGFKQLGLRLSFPDDRTWEISCHTKKDSGSVFMPLWNIVQCAREVVRA